MPRPYAPLWQQIWQQVSRQRADMLGNIKVFRCLFGCHPVRCRLSILPVSRNENLFTAEEFCLVSNLLGQADMLRLLGSLEKTCRLQRPLMLHGLGLRKC